MMYMAFVASHASFGPNHIGEEAAQMYEYSGPMINPDEWHLGDPYEVELTTTAVPDIW